MNEIKEEKLAGAFERLQGVSDVLAKARDISEEIVGPEPSDLDKGVAVEPTDAMARIDAVLCVIEGRVDYLLSQLVHIRQLL